MSNEKATHPSLRQARLKFAACLSLWISIPFLSALLAQQWVSIGLAVTVYALIVAGLFARQLTKPLEKAPVDEMLLRSRRWLTDIAWAWGVVLLCFQAAIIARILAERAPVVEGPVTTFSNCLVQLLSPVVPALRELPEDMARNGYAPTSHVVTDSFALAYAAALINIGISVLALGWFVIHLVRFGKYEPAPTSPDDPDLPLHRKIMIILGWPLLIGLYVSSVFFLTGVQAHRGRKEIMPDFETSEFQLYFRTLIGTGVGTAGFCFMVLGSAVGIAYAGFRLQKPTPRGSSPRV